MTQGAGWPGLRRNLVAILRGVRPDEVVALGEALVAAGFDAIEVPLNSPEPLDSIARLVRALPPAVLVGAGTVLSAGAVDDVRAAGGRLVVSPNTDASVIGRAATLGMVSLPGVFTPSEAFAAAGVRVFGLGSSLYRAGLGAAEVGARAVAAVAAYDAVFAKEG